MNRYNRCCHSPKRRSLVSRWAFPKLAGDTGTSIVSTTDRLPPGQRRSWRLLRAERSGLLGGNRVPNRRDRRPAPRHPREASQHHCQLAEDPHVGSPQEPKGVRQIASIDRYGRQIAMAMETAASVSRHASVAQDQADSPAILTA